MSGRWYPGFLCGLIVVGVFAAWYFWPHHNAQSLASAVATPAGDAPALVHALAPATAPSFADIPAVPTYNEHIVSILSDRCFRCHGLDHSTRKAGLRLDKAEETSAARKNGPAIVPGKPEASQLMRRILSTDPQEIMPPPESHQTLSDNEREMLRRWIAAGAVYEPHWSFVTPHAVKPPNVEGKVWTGNPIDAFVRARLERAGIPSSASADMRTLARRVSLDLTGLPPRPEEVDALVADTAPDAYERYVDRLLASPRWGEHRARYWLDTVRYADTHGEHFDNYRMIWPYRDWVIAAFNANMPFNQFITMQIAGDLLPAPKLDDLVASGFVRMHPTTAEGGSVPEEVQMHYVKDRTDSIGLAFLGLSVQCAGCHDHKYDPISQRDYYRLSAFFNNTTDTFSDMNVESPPPTIPVPADKEQRAKVENLLAELATTRASISAHRAAAVEKAQAWYVAQADKNVLRVSDDQLTLLLPCDEGSGAVLHNRAPKAMTASYTVGDTSPAWGYFDRVGLSMRLPHSAAARFPDQGDVGRDQAWSFATWIYVQSDFGKRGRKDFSGSGYICGRLEKAGKPGWAFEYKEGRLEVSLYDGKKGVLQVRSAQVLPRRTWAHVAVVRRPDQKPGISIALDGVPLKVELVKDTIKDAIRTNTPFYLGRLGDPTAHILSDVRMADVRLYQRALTDDDLQRLPWAVPAAAILETPAAQWNAEQRWHIEEWYLHQHDPEVPALVARVNELTNQLDDMDEKLPRTLIARERNERPVSYLLRRGDYNQCSERLDPGVPAVLPPLPQDAPLNRLGLAQWLTNPNHPLTARVTVNRMWQEIFGVGLVESAEDFGVMGTRPSHPELLDWLAVELRSSWDVKKIYRLMVTSATYRQQSMMRPDCAERDPKNRLLARGPRFRMDAEMIRDQALTSAGLIVERVGGPSVKPYAPEGIWDGLSHIQSKTSVYKADVGDGLYRRSLYTFWKRHGPPAQLETFNAPARDLCVARRERTNTPLQALAILNDVQYVEAARVLATHAMIAGAGSTEKIMHDLVQRVLMRPLLVTEQRMLLSGYEKLAADFQRHPEAATALITHGSTPLDTTLNAPQLAAWTMIAHAVLASDEALNK